MVDIADTVAGHLLAAERGHPGTRYVLNGATVPASEALLIPAPPLAVTLTVATFDPVLVGLNVTFIAQLAPAVVR